MKKIIFASICATVLISFASCKKDKPAPVPDEQELITTLIIRLNDSAGFDQTFQYKITGGYNTASPTIQIDTVKIPSGKRYHATLMVLNESKSPVEDITTEILEKNEEHLFVFQSSPAELLQVSNGNKDAKGLPLNQEFTLTSDKAGSGTFRITLMHQPTNKNGSTPQSAGGETDLEAGFPVLVQ